MKNLANVLNIKQGRGLDDLLVKYRYAAEGATGPLSKIRVKFGMYGLQKRSHDGDLEGRSGDGSLLQKV